MNEIIKDRAHDMLVRMAALEHAVFGKIYDFLPIPIRLDNLEKAVFSNNLQTV